MKENITLREKIKNLPHVPGCYLYKNKNGTLIYVGKAKDLNKRINSYLNKASNFKTMLLVSEIADFEYITTNNEKEALILEQNLIKKNLPKYNILLADDKWYPYIQVTNEKDPQYRYVRKAMRDKGRFFGPFPDGSGAREILKLLERIFPLRKCAGNLGKPCLFYYLGQCSGACFQQVPQSYYQNTIKQINQFFHGNVTEIKKQLVHSMNISAENLQFEAANKIKQLLEKIDVFLAQQLVQFQDLLDRDFINFIQENNYISIVTLFYRNGKLQAKDEQVIANNFLDLQDFIRNYCSQLYNKNTLPKEIYLPKTVDLTDLKILFAPTKFFHPIKGKKEQIISTAKTNAIYGWKNYIEKQKNSNLNFMSLLGQWLNIEHLNHLEVFDVSNLNQNASVGGMIVYKNNQPSVNDYRRFFLDQRLRDDYHRFQEMIYRRYFNLLINKLPLPDLIVVDGGKLQINATNEMLDKLNIKIPIIGLVKNKKHQTDHVLNQDLRLINIPKNDICFKFLTNLQDQVHNFAIKYHKMKRSQSMLGGILGSVSGIGPKLQNKILEKFPDFNSLMKAEKSELQKIIKSKLVVEKLWTEINSFT